MKPEREGYEFKMSDLYPKKKAKRIPKVSRKRMPTKNRTEWGWKFPDGREVCDLRISAGREEYRSRVDDMCYRQSLKCKCRIGISVDGTGDHRATFGHDIPRGFGGGSRDDRIWDEFGRPMNHAECWNCNSEKGSKRSTSLPPATSGSTDEKKGDR